MIYSRSPGMIVNTCLRLHVAREIPEYCSGSPGIYAEHAQVNTYGDLTELLFSILMSTCI